MDENVGSLHTKNDEFFFADFQTLRDTRIKVYSRFEKKKKASRDIKRAALAQEQGR